MTTTQELGMTSTIVYDGRSPLAQQQRNGSSGTLRPREWKRLFCFIAGNRSAARRLAHLRCETEFMLF